MKIIFFDIQKKYIYLFPSVTDYLKKSEILNGHVPIISDNSFSIVLFIYTTYTGTDS